MVNPWLMFAGIGMILVGFVPAIWWFNKKKVSARYFFLGALVWFIAITPKIIMDVTVTPPLNSYLTNFGTMFFAVTLGLYVGLRTGLFESGFIYLVGLKTKLKHVAFDEAVAFGLGFGGVEAVLLGFQSFLTILSFTVMPDLISQIPETQRGVIVQQLSQSTWVIFAPILERGMTLLIHVFASILVFYAIHTSVKRYLLYSIGYKTIVDGIIPALSVYVGSSTLTSIYLMEMPVAGLGLIAAGGILWVRSRWRNLDAEGNDSVE
ncbi:MAG TPA: YhfC family intramembrane metalloprotease [Thermoplasmatales archaeon]|nr:YhfC family intramembrane metalloprotease [Thermoplasmatales archaeon]